jgi:hypothetical protein
MHRVVLISCASKKLPTPAKARDLYISPLFRLNLAYAESLKPEAIFILSAKHGLVPLEKKLAPYNETLNTKKDAAIKAWAKKVCRQLGTRTNVGSDEFILLAGERYRRHLLPFLKHSKTPLQGLGLGKQLQFLKRALV